jgi:hypothetical protein
VKSDLAPRCVRVGFYVRSSSLQPTQLLQTTLLLLHLLVSEWKVGFHKLPADIGRGELISTPTRSFRLLEVLRFTLFCEASRQIIQRLGQATPRSRIYQQSYRRILRILLESYIFSLHQSHQAGPDFYCLRLQRCPVPTVAILPLTFDASHFALLLLL